MSERKFHESRSDQEAVAESIESNLPGLEEVAAHDLNKFFISIDTALDSRVTGFRKECEDTYESLEIDEFLVRVAGTIDRLEEIATSKTSIADTGHVPIFLETLKLRLPKMSPTLAQEFDDWIEDELSDPSSLMAVECWRHEVTNILDDQRRSFPKDFEERAKSVRLAKNIMRRLQSLADFDGQGAYEPSDSSDALKQFLFHKLQEAKMASPKDDAGKVIGTAQEDLTGIGRRFEEDIAEFVDPHELLDKFDQAYLEDSDTRYERLNFRSALKTDIDYLKYEYFGEDFQQVGGVEFSRTRTVPDEYLKTVSSTKSEILKRRFEDIMETLAGIFYDPRYVRCVRFDENYEDCAGEYLSSDKTIVIYRLNNPQPRELARILLHEAGHAIDPRLQATLSDAIKSNIMIAKGVERRGYSSTYSETAREYYKNRFHLSDPSYDPDGFFSEADLSEEWAEMFAFCLTQRSFSAIYPDKRAVVEDVLNGLGLDLPTVFRGINPTVSFYETQSPVPRDLLSRLSHRAFTIDELARMLETPHD